MYIRRARHVHLARRVARSYGSGKLRSYIAGVRYLITGSIGGRYPYECEMFAPPSPIRMEVAIGRLKIERHDHECQCSYHRKARRRIGYHKPYKTQPIKVFHLKVRGALYCAVWRPRPQPRHGEVTS